MFAPKRSFVQISLGIQANAVTSTSCPDTSNIQLWLSYLCALLPLFDVKGSTTKKEKYCQLSESLNE